MYTDNHLKLILTELFDLKQNTAIRSKKNTKSDFFYLFAGIFKKILTFIRKMLSFRFPVVLPIQCPTENRSRKSKVTGA